MTFTCNDGNTTINSFRMQGEPWDGYGLSNLQASGGEANLVLEDKAGNVLYDTLIRVPTGGSWITVNVNVANVYKFTIKPTGGSTAPYNGVGFWPRIDDLVYNTPIDQDGDGFAPPEDCDDTDPSVYPGAPEIYDGIDNDCDGIIDNDYTAPEIVLNNPEATFFDALAGYTEYGATATDDKDGDISANVIVSGDYFARQGLPGKHTITYEVADAAGNTASVQREIRIGHKRYAATGNVQASFTRTQVLSLNKGKGRATFGISNFGAFPATYKIEGRPGNALWPNTKRTLPREIQRVRPGKRTNVAVDYNMSAPLNFTGYLWEYYAAERDENNQWKKYGWIRRGQGTAPSGMQQWQPFILSDNVTEDGEAFEVTFGIEGPLVRAPVTIRRKLTIRDAEGALMRQELDHIGAYNFMVEITGVAYSVPPGGTVTLQISDRRITYRAPKLGEN